MKTCQSTGSFQRVYPRLLLCFISSVVFAGSAQAFTAPNSINQCYDCHGSPTIAAGGGTDIRPVDATYRNITTGALVGNHQTHIPLATVNPQACTPCHGTAPANMDHRNGVINMRLHINSSAVNVRGYYNKPVGSPAAFFNQTSVPQLSTCNNVNCHFRTTSPSWGVTPLVGQSVANCQVCHQSTGMNTGNHTKHITKFGSTISTCSTCHLNRTTFSHASSAKAGRSITVTFAGAPSLSTGGSYTAGTHASYPNYFGVTGYGTCNTVYCHSTVQSATGGALTYKAQTWGVTLACSGCHGSTTADLLSGSHSKHLGSTYVFSCSDCHGAGYSSTTVNDPTHADQTINISLISKSPAGTYSGDGIPQNSNFGVCNTTICHGTNSAAWGSSVSNQTCTECHGQPNVAYANTSSAIIAPGGAGVDTGGKSFATDPRVGAHQAHLTASANMSAPIRCGECHTTHTTVQDAAHLNYTTATVTFQNAALAKLGAPLNTHNPVATKVSGIVNCNNTYCHSAAYRQEGTGANQTGFATRVAPVWNNSTLIGGTTIADTCTAKCHNLPPGAGVAGDTHAALSAVTTFSGLSACSGCHSVTLNASPSSFPTIFKDVTKHINGIVEAAGDCNSCHDYDAVGSTFTASVWSGGSWGKNPQDGLTPPEGFGAHVKHINYIKTRLGYAVALNPVSQTFGAAGTDPARICGTCHTNDVASHTTSGSTSRSITFGTGGVLNTMGSTGGTSLLFGTTFPAQNPVYNGVSGTSKQTTAKTCSNISCHYFTTPNW